MSLRFTQVRQKDLKVSLRLLDQVMKLLQSLIDRLADHMLLSSLCGNRDAQDAVLDRTKRSLNSSSELHVLCRILLTSLLERLVKVTLCRVDLALQRSGKLLDVLGLGICDKVSKPSGMEAMIN